MICQNCKKNVASESLHICSGCDAVLCSECAAEGVCPSCLNETNYFS
ncbi:MAG: hypothetical protein LBT30_02305 [Clostridiales bacterium]|nr:hypothetical protein [Clostridiales bacterium]